MPNAYFSFPYAPTSFADSRACSSVVSQCAANYDSCTSRLGGAAGTGAGVTVVVPGAGGTTVVGGAQAGATVPTASATGICSSLSSAACGGLQAGVCSGAGTTGGFVVGTGTGTGNAAAARQTGCAVGMVVAGVGWGLMNGL